jgi:hypothetical protein
MKNTLFFVLNAQRDMVVVIYTLVIKTRREAGPKQLIWAIL